MDARSSRFYAAWAEGAVMAALLAVPLYFTVFTDRVFEPEKAGLLRALAVVAAAAGVVAWRAAPPRAHVRAVISHPIAQTAIAVWAAEMVATATSVAPWTSVMGAYSRGQGLATTTALLVVGLGSVSVARRPGGAERLAAVIGASVLPAGLYGIAQAYGLDPLPWQGDVVTRVAGPAGASVIFGAHLVMALPLAAWSAHRAWRRARAGRGPAAAIPLAAWLTVAAVGLWSLALSGSRGPVLGLGAGALIAALAMAARAGRRGAAVALAAGGAAIVLLVVGLNVATARGAAGPLAAMGRFQFFDRLSRALDPENSTTRVRLRLWEGSVEALAADPPRLIAGYGPETMDLIWAPHYPPILAYDEPRGWVPDRAHNLALDTLLTGGILGLGATLAFFTALVGACLRALGLPRAAVASTSDARSGTAPVAPPRAPRPSAWIACWLAGGIAAAAAARIIDGTWRLAGPAMGLGMVGGLALWLVWQAWRAGPPGEIRARPPAGSAGPAFAAAALAAVTAHWVEAQVGFPVTATRLVTWTLAGGMVGLAARRLATPQPLESGSAAPRPLPSSEITPADGIGGRAGWDGLFAACVVGTTAVFDFVRPGIVGGGYPIVVALIVLSAALVGVALGGNVEEGSSGQAGRDAIDRNDTDGEGVRRGTGDRGHGDRAHGDWGTAGGARDPMPGRRWRNGFGGGARAALTLAAFAVVHLALVRLEAFDPAAALRAVAAVLAWYGLGIAVLMLARARRVAGGWPERRWAARGGLVLAPAAVLAAGAGFGPTVADALYKEGRLAWQAPVNDLREEGQSGKAESFLERAQARYDLAARLAPWEPAYRLARARAAVEWGDLLDARLSGALAGAGLAGAADEYDPALLGGDAARLAGERDARFAAALAAVDQAAALSGPAPGPALTGARALRVWGGRTREPGRRARRLADARGAYSRALALAPRWPEVLDEAAAAALLADEPRAALDLAARAVALDPFYVRARRTAASAHAQAGDPAAAAEAYRRYFEDYRNASDLAALRAYLVALVGAGRPADALPIARDITRLAPGDAHGHADLAVLLDQTGDTTGALAAARRAAALDPRDEGIAALVRRLEGGAGGGGR